MFEVKCKYSHKICCYFSFAGLQHGTHPSRQFASLRTENIKVEDPSTIDGRTSGARGPKDKPTRVSLTNGTGKNNTEIPQQNLLSIRKSTLTSTQYGRTQSTPPNLGSFYSTLVQDASKQIYVVLTTKILSPLAQDNSQDVSSSRAAVHGLRLFLRQAYRAWRVASAVWLDYLRPNRRRNLF